MQYSVGVYWGKGDYPVYWVRARAGQSKPDEANLLLYRGDLKQPLSLSFGIVFLIEGSTMDIVDHGSRSNESCGGRGGWDPGMSPHFYLLSGRTVLSVHLL